MVVSFAEAMLRRNGRRARSSVEKCKVSNRVRDEDAGRVDLTSDQPFWSSVFYCDLVSIVLHGHERISQAVTKPRLPLSVTIRVSASPLPLSHVVLLRSAKAPCSEYENVLFSSEIVSLRLAIMLYGLGADLRS
jgi:hypothetical protein